MTKEEIINEILQNKLIYIGESIDYIKFKEIHKLYSNFTEKQIAFILGINDNSLKLIRLNPHKKAIVLKDKLEEYQIKLGRIIESEILKEYEAGQQITYSEFTELRNRYSLRYGEIIEIRFAEYLEISKESLRRLRNNYPTTIFSSKFKEKEIIDSLIDKELIHPGDKLTYDEFISLYNKARNIHPSIRHYSVYAFGKLLEIRKSSITRLKSNNQDKITILKSRIKIADKEYAVTQEERIKIIDYLINNRQAKPYEICNYKRFQELYNGFNLSELDFAIIIGISKENFSSLKNNGKEVKILKDFLDKEQIVQEIINSGIVEIGQLITYKTFKLILDRYSYLGPFIIADILEISEGNLERIRLNENAKTIVFKSRIEKEPKNIITYNDIVEKVKEYINKLFELNKITIGQKITYEEFKKIYNECNYIKEFEFAYYLGISNFQYYSMRLGERSTIQDFHTLEALKLIETLEKNRYYTEEEINSICSTYKIDIETFIRYFVYKRNIKGKIDYYIDVLNKTGKIYIGRTNMSNEFFLSIYNQIEKNIKHYIHYICYLYGQLKNIEDYISEVYLFILERCGDLEMNFDSNNDIEKLIPMILNRIKLFLLPLIVKNIKREQIEINSGSYYINRTNSEYIFIDNPDSEVEQILIISENEELDERIINYIINNINNKSLNDILEDICLIFDVPEQYLTNLYIRKINEIDKILKKKF